MSSIYRLIQIDLSKKIDYIAINSLERCRLIDTNRIERIDKYMDGRTEGRRKERKE